MSVSRAASAPSDAGCSLWRPRRGPTVISQAASAEVSSSEGVRGSVVSLFAALAEVGRRCHRM
jgi:hypothetical protein